MKAAPTVGFIWGDGPTGYSIKYAWQSSAPGADRIVLITDRQIAAVASLAPAPADAADRDFTVIEMRLDGKGGEAKISFANVVIDSAAKTLALEGYDTAPTVLKVTR